MPFSVQVNVSMLDALSPKLKAMERRFAQLSSVVDKSGERMKKFGAAATAAGSRLTIGVTAPIIAASIASLKLASDAEETANKFDAVFKGIGDAGSDTVTSLSDDFKLATSTSQELLSNTGDLLVGLGLTRREALSLADGVVRLSADVASFKNVQGGAERAADSLTKALLGEREMLKETFKTAVSEAEVQERAKEIMAERTELTERQAKALATLQIVTERNKDAIGDFAKTQEGLANQMRIFQEQLKGVAERFGKVMIPVALKAIKAFSFLLDIFTAMPESMIAMITLMAGLAAALGPIILIAGQAALAMTLFTTANLIAAKSAALASLAFVKMGIVAVASLAPFLPIILAVGAAIVLVAALIFKFWIPIKSFFAGIWEGFLLGFSPVIDSFQELFSVAQFGFDLIMTLFGGLLDQTDAGASGFQTFGKIVGIIMGGIASAMSIPLIILGKLIKGLKLIAKLIPGVNNLISAVKLDTAGIEAEAARPAPAFSNPLIGKPEGTQVNQNIQITAQFDAAGNLIGATSTSDSPGETKIETVNQGQITPLIL